MPFVCFVRGCDSGSRKANGRYDAQGIPRPSMFKPRENQLESWRLALRQEGKILQKSDRVCSLHFKDGDIERYYETKLSDGTISKLPRAFPYLRSEAVPFLSNTDKVSATFEPSEHTELSSRDTTLISVETLTPTTFSEDDIPVAAYGNIFSSVASDEMGSQEQSADNSMNTAVSASQTSSLILLASDSAEYDQNSSDFFQPDVDDIEHHDHQYAKSAKLKPFNLEELHSKALDINLPGDMWGIHRVPKSKTGFSHINENDQTDRTVIITDSLKPKVYIKGKLIETPGGELKNVENLESFLQEINTYFPCPGINGSSKIKFSKLCKGFFIRKGAHPPKRCLNCKIERRKLQRLKPVIPIETRVTGAQRKIKSLNMSVLRKQRKIQSLSGKLKEMISQCKNLPEETQKKALNSIPEEQREGLKAIFDASKRKSSRGRRYTRQWVYDCLLMRIRGPQLYRKLRVENKLPLPSNRTLERYLKSLRPEYGFQENLFEIMKEKGKEMKEEEKRGCLLLDEMQVDEAVKFVKDSMKVHGLVNLGKYTRKQDATARGNHALVLMYQPFRGPWVQAVGAFLGKGAVPGTILKQLVLEGIILLENAGFKVDCVTSDGASWNRNMWDMFGITKDKTYIDHPVDINRKLYYASDFPHLIKCLWTRIANKGTLSTPDGIIKLKHWESVVEENKKLGIKINYVLNDHHLKPTTYQKMNVKMAMQFFSHKVAAAMEFHKKKGVPALEDAEPTIEFIKRINVVIDALNSQLPSEALYADPNSTHFQTLTKFVEYLEMMNQQAASKRKRVVASRPSRRGKGSSRADVSVGLGQARDELTTSTFLGLLVTSRTALGLVGYLAETAGYKFLMTRRINQDNLEHFFGLIRQSCGPNVHPDPLLFIQLYRLLSTYSLVKPPRGSNVTGGEMISTLLQLSDVIGEKNTQRREEFEKKIDEICDNITDFPDYDNFDNITTDQINENALTVFAGYIARKLMKTAAKHCDECQTSLRKPAAIAGEATEREEFIQILSHGGLIWPSDELFTAIRQIEVVITRTVASMDLHRNFLFSILEELTIDSPTSYVGCPDHAPTITSALISFYLVCRMYFVCSEANKSAAEQKRQKKWLGKQAKLN